MAHALSRNCTVAVGPTTASAVAWRFRGELRVSVIAKATFAFASDAAMRRVKPHPVVAGEVHHANNPLRSIVLASDVVPYRRRADVFFTGHAYAPAGTAVESIAVRFGVASGGSVVLDKTLHVRKRGGFKRIPMLYEHTVGGPENPQGEDPGSDANNLFDPTDPARPAGFGPLSRSTPARKRLIGDAVIPDLGPAPVVIPDNFDFESFQAAPADQQIGFLRGDEWILLENLHPQQPIVRTALPSARAVARIHGLAEVGIPEGRPLAMVADTLHVSGDEEVCSVTWRGTFPMPREEALSAVRVAVGVELPGEPVAWPDVAIAAAPKAAVEISYLPSEPVAAPSAQHTLPVSPAKVDPATLPFRPSSLGAAAIIAASTGKRAPMSGSDGATLPLPDDNRFGADPLPFLRAEPARASEPPAAAAAESAPPPKRREEIWAPAPPPPPEAPRPAPKPRKMPPKVDVKHKLYGTKKKG